MTKRLLINVLAVGFGCGVAFAEPGQSSTSVAIDPSLFREGAIKRFSGTHDGWTYVCDEVAKMKKRFCSLRTTAKDVTGKVVAALTVSTGEDGRPAALLRMAAASFNEAGVEVTGLVAEAGGAAPAPVKSGAKPVAKAGAARVVRVHPASCKAEVCDLIWTLPPDHIAALSGGSGLQLRYTTPAPGVSSLASALKAGTNATVVVVVPAKGFAAAVDASVKPMP